MKWSAIANALASGRFPLENDIDKTDSTQAELGTETSDIEIECDDIGTAKKLYCTKK